MRRESKRYGEFVDFLASFVVELNLLSLDGYAVLVEGKRDAEALRNVGFRGTLLTMASVTVARGLPDHIIIMTDLDREGGQLATRLSRKLARQGVNVSLSHRKRLLLASRGVFRHIENLSRFGDQLA
jgi:5S rRNA maturation endonuclease (ribonuclease M5)